MSEQYTQAAIPRAVAPHFLVQGRSLSDYFGRDFTLLWLGIKSPTANWHTIADALGIPLHIEPCGLPQARALYGADLVLIGPDGHIAWRGDLTADAHAVLRHATLK